MVLFFTGNHRGSILPRRLVLMVVEDLCELIFLECTNMEVLRRCQKGPLFSNEQTVYLSTHISKLGERYHKTFSTGAEILNVRLGKHMLENKGRDEQDRFYNEALRIEHDGGPF